VLCIQTQGRTRPQIGRVQPSPFSPQHPTWRRRCWRLATRTLQAASCRRPLRPLPRTRTRMRSTRRRRPSPCAIGWRAPRAASHATGPSRRRFSRPRRERVPRSSACSAARLGPSLPRPGSPREARTHPRMLRSRPGRMARKARHRGQDCGRSWPLRASSRRQRCANTWCACTVAAESEHGWEEPPNTRTRE